MIYTTHTIDSTRTPLIVGQFFDDSVLAATSDGQIFKVPRAMIETPVLCCKKCGKPVLLKIAKRTKKEYTECPDHARHMYEELYAASHDVKNYSRGTRRKFYKQALMWLGVWRKAFETRTQQKVSCEGIGCNANS